jgi:uncharacterized protein
MLGRLNDSEIELVLKHNLLGRIACYDDAKIYIVPINYVYDGKDIIAHSVQGMKIEMMRRNPQICFEVDEIKDFTNWKSVIVWGEYQELSDSAERYRAMKYFVDHTLRTKISETAIPPEISEDKQILHAPGDLRPIISRIVIL